MERSPLLEEAQSRLVELGISPDYVAEDDDDELLEWIVNAPDLDILAWAMDEFEGQQI